MSWFILIVEDTFEIWHQKIERYVHKPHDQIVFKELKSSKIGPSESIGEE